MNTPNTTEQTKGMALFASYAKKLPENVWIPFENISPEEKPIVTTHTANLQEWKKEQSIEELDIIAQENKELKEALALSQARIQQLESVWTKKQKKTKTFYSPEWSYFMQVLRTETDGVRLSELSDCPLSDSFIPLVAVSHIFDRESPARLAEVLARLEKRYGAHYIIKEIPDIVVYWPNGQSRKFSAVAKHRRGAWITIDGLLRLLEHFAKKNVTDDDSERIPLRYDGNDIDTSANRLRFKTIVGRKTKKNTK